MPAITVKNIPNSLYMSLKTAAALHHRSINSEVIVCLEKVLLSPKVDPERLLGRIRELRARTGIAISSHEELNQMKETGRK